MGLALDSPLDVWQLAEHLEIPVIPLSSLKEAAPLAAALFLNEGQGIFSGVTVFRGNERTIVFNDSHVPGRQVSDIRHELSHGLLLHPPNAAMDELGCRYWDRDVEDEANWLSGALLVPEEGCSLAVELLTLGLITHIFAHIIFHNGLQSYMPQRVVQSSQGL